MRRLLIVGAVAVALSGCTLAARMDMAQSKAALKACLAQHPQDVQACAGAQAAYQADLAAYQAMPRPVMVSAGGDDWLEGQMQAQQLHNDLWALQGQIQAQQLQDFTMQSQANFWAMVGATR